MEWSVMKHRKTPIIGLVFAIVMASFMPFIIGASENASAEPDKVEPEAYNQTIADLIDNVSASNIYSYIYDLQNFTTRFLFSSKINLSAEYISNHYSNYSNLIVESQYFNYSGYIVRNIIATLPSFNPSNKSVYIVGGHYDSVCYTGCNSFANPETPAPGADDDASGTVVAMEAARVMSKYKYNATIIFAAWTAEEVGLIGSDYYARDAAESGMDIDGMLQFDMVGYDPLNTMGLDIGYDLQSIWLSDLMVDMNNVYTIGLTPYTGPGGGGSDHVSFWAQDYPAIMAIEHTFNTPNYHRVTDTVDKLNMDLIERTTKAAVATLAELAGVYTPGVGILALDKSEYSIPDTVGITLWDPDLNLDSGALDGATVTASSNTEPLGEVVTLTETGVNTSIFAGSIDLTQIPTVGELEVIHGDLITVSYDDLSPPGIRTATAVVDDIAPIISDVIAIPDVTTATITWNTDEKANSKVNYDTSAPLLQSSEDPSHVLQHSINLNGLTPNTTYYFDALSTDPAGNTAIDDNGGAHYTFRTLSGISSTPEYGYVGWVRSTELTGNHFTDPQILVGHSDKRPPTFDVTYKGAAQFHTDSIPVGATITSAKVSFYGNEWIYNEVPGNWDLVLLDQSIDSNWINHAYPDMEFAPIDATAQPTLDNSDLEVGVWNTFYFSPAQFPMLRSRVNTGNISFRIDGPSPPTVTVGLIFAWSSGNKVGGGMSPEAPRLTITYSMTGDSLGPIIVNKLAEPNPTWGAPEVTLNATASDATTGNSGVVGVEYYVDVDPGLGNGFPLMPVDEGFDSDTEDATLLVDVTSLPFGMHTVYIRALDSAGNWGPEETIILSVQPPDAKLPEIENVTALPSPQEIFGNVNITANITDNLVVSGAWINITRPDASWDNQSMNNVLDSFYYDITYDLLGTHDFVIWASDQAGNWNSSIGAFEIIDSIPPSILVSVNPPQQEVHGWVNVSATITDAIEVYGAWINMTKPDASQLNDTMYNTSATEFYYNITYDDLLGPYDFTIWANDTNDNWNSALGNFEIVDTTPPNANAGADIFTDEDALVAFDASSSSDNFLIDNYTWTFIDNSVGIFLYGQFPTYTFNSPGAYIATLKVTDTVGLWDTDIVVVSVADVTYPIADAGDDIYTDEDAVVIFNGLGSSDNSGQINYTWSFFDDGPKYLFGPTPPYTFQTPGVYTVTLTVMDLAGLEDTDNLIVYVSDITLPVIDAYATPEIQEVFGSVKISSEVSDNYQVDKAFVEINYGLDESIGNFSMLFDAPSNTFTFSMIYDTVGGYNFTVWANDTSDNWNSYSGSFLIQDSTNPTIDHDPVSSGAVDETITIRALIEDNYGVKEVKIVYTDVDGILHNESMDLSEGQYVFTIPAQPSPGTITYTILAEDENGNVAVTEEYIISIEAEQFSPIIYALLVLIIFVLLILLIMYYYRRKTKGTKEEFPPEENLPE